MHKESTLTYLWFLPSPFHNLPPPPRSRSSFVSFAFISALIFKIFFILLTLEFFISPFSSCFRCSVQFSRSVVSDSLRSHESQHASPPCPSPTPGVHSDSRHRVSDAIQSSHPLPSPSPPAPNPAQHQSCSVVSNSLRPHGL